ncbi:hypothetical protein GCM10007207_01960 [Asaia siamensis]|uniref:Uncharacterized protein n=1 Tax=Asaia siamensis TaxID=110479 RepID=A0ABQ1L6U6_9PROT|nr:hypothetical protein GCM10007207_01960 [Asaia siamensis]
MRAVESDHRLLNGVKRPGAADILNGEQGSAIEHRQKLDAGIYSLQDHAISAQPRDYDRAGATITFVASFFRACAAFVTQPVKQGLVRGNIVQTDKALPQIEPYRLTHEAPFKKWKADE